MIYFLCPSSHTNFKCYTAFDVARAKLKMSHQLFKGKQKVYLQDISIRSHTFLLVALDKRFRRTGVCTGSQGTDSCIQSKRPQKVG